MVFQLICDYFVKDKELNGQNGQRNGVRDCAYVPEVKEETLTLTLNYCRHGRGASAASGLATPQMAMLTGERFTNNLGHKLLHANFACLPM